jgi:hypothetical protein
MSRIRKTVFNNIAGDTSVSQINAFVSNANLAGILLDQNKNNKLNLNSATYNLTLDEFVNKLGLNSYNLYVVPIYNGIMKILFGEDSLDFIKQLVSIFGLNNQLNGVTNKLEFVIINQAQTLGADILLVSNSNTSNYFEIGPPPSSTSLKVLYPPTLNISNVLTITAIFNSNNEVIKVSITD